MTHFFSEIQTSIYNWLNEHFSEVSLWICSAIFFGFSKVVFMDTMEIVLKLLSAISLIIAIVIQLKKYGELNDKIKASKNGSNS